MEKETDVDKKTMFKKMFTRIGDVLKLIEDGGLETSGEENIRQVRNICVQILILNIHFFFFSSSYNMYNAADLS